MNRVHIPLQGFYRLKVGKPGQEPRIDTGWFPNLITDNGLDLMYLMPTGVGDIKYFCPRCCVGSGNNPPAFTDTTLQTFVAQTGSPNEYVFTSSNFVEESGDIPAYWSSVGSYRFATGTAAGNLAEIGIGASSTNLFSRALILDGDGNPTTITVLSDEVLDVTYELRVYINKAQVPITIDISGTNYSGYVQPFNVDSPPSFSSAWKVATGNLSFYAYSTHTEPASIYAGPGSGSQYPGSNTLISSYIPGSYYLDLRYAWSQSQANVGGINLFGTNYSFTSFMIWFDDQIPKQDYQNFSLDVRLSWGRYAP